jgi:hypothetical protein
MCGSGWVASSFCMSRMVVCIPRVLSVRAFMCGWVYSVLSVDGMVWVGELGWGMLSD